MSLFIQPSFETILCYCNSHNPFFMNLRKQVFQCKAFIAVAGMAILLKTGCNPSLRFATVRYDAAQIRYLLDSGSMTNIVFQFKSEKGGNYKKPFSLISYAYHDSISIGNSTIFEATE